MQTVQEITRAIRQLSLRELDELYAWLEVNCPQPIDLDLQADLEAGRMDARINRALTAHGAGSSRPL